MLRLSTFPLQMGFVFIKNVENCTHWPLHSFICGFIFIGICNNLGKAPTSVVRILLL